MSSALYTTPLPASPSYFPKGPTKWSLRGEDFIMGEGLTDHENIERFVDKVPVSPAASLDLDFLMKGLHPLNIIRTKLDQFNHSGLVPHEGW